MVRPATCGLRQRLAWGKEKGSISRPCTRSPHAKESLRAVWSARGTGCRRLHVISTLIIRARMNYAPRTQATPAKRNQRLPDPSRFESFRLYQAARLWQKCLGSALKPLGLTPTQFGLLFHTAWLEGEGEPVSQVMLAHATHHDVMTVSQVLRALERRRLVTRLSHPRDPRAKATSLTATGARTAARGLQLALRAKNAFFGVLGADEPELRRMLDMLISSQLESRQAPSAKEDNGSARRYPS